MNKVAVMMTVISKLLGLMALRHSAQEGKAAVQRFFTGLTTALIFALISGMLLGAALVGAHFIVYQLLIINTDLSPLECLFATFGACLVLTTIFAGLAILRVKMLFDKPKVPEKLDLNPLHFDPALAGEKLGQKIGGLAEAFFDGLRDSRRPRQPQDNPYADVQNVSQFNRRNYP